VPARAALHPAAAALFGGDLVRELEEKGVGRPSTYATILSTIQDRGYVEKKEGRLGPTELGVVVNGLLVKSFPRLSAPTSPR